jgi:ABC-2 type transport system ATP-binding protein
VICTHNLAEAETLADMIAIIYRGHILMAGSLEELKQKVLGIAEYEAKFSSVWQNESFDIPQGVTLKERRESSLRFSIQNPDQANPLLVRSLSSLQAPLVAFQEVPRSLEQVYLKAMADVQMLRQEAVHAG